MGSASHSNVLRLYVGNFLMIKMQGECRAMSSSPLAFAMFGRKHSSRTHYLNSVPPWCICVGWTSGVNLELESGRKRIIH